MRIRKNNKKLKNFDKKKIIESIRAASNSTESETIPQFLIVRIADSIEEELIKQETKIIDSLTVSHMVENRLMKTSYKDVAKSYITYHHDRQQERLYESEMIKAFENKLNASNIENANANCDERSFSGRMNEAARVLLKDNALKTMSKKFRDNHINNEVYTHDLDSYSSGQHNCLSIPFDNMFSNGVHIKQTDIRSPKSISTAMQLIAVFIQVQSLQQFGGVSSTHLDWTLVPYVRHSFFKHLRVAKKYLFNEDWKVPKNCQNISIDDYKDENGYQYAIDMTAKETLQASEGFIHNLNSLQSRSGQQLPFSSINYGTCTSTEGRLVINAILDATLDGTGPLHKTPIFPCGIFQYDSNINGKPGSPNYDLFKKALYCTSKRFYPNYANCGWSINKQGIESDIKHKRLVLSKLSEDNMTKLVNWVNNNEEEAKNYKMIVEDNKVIIDENLIHPVEIMSTMGKCKLQPI